MSARHFGRPSLRTWGRSWATPQSTFSETLCPVTHSQLISAACGEPALWGTVFRGGVAQKSTRPHSSGLDENRCDLGLFGAVFRGPRRSRLLPAVCGYHAGPGSARRAPLALPGPGDSRQPPCLGGVGCRRGSGCALRCTATRPPLVAGSLPEWRGRAVPCQPGALRIVCGQMFRCGRGPNTPCRSAGMLGPRAVVALLAGRCDQPLRAALAVQHERTKAAGWRPLT